MDRMGRCVAIWRLTKDESKSIAGEDLAPFLNHIMIYANEIGYRGFSYRGYDIGDEMKSDILFGEEYQFMPAWERLRLAIEGDRMPPPIAGVNPFAHSGKKTVSGNGSCSCDIFTLMNFGCPSARGGKCRSA